MKAIKRITVFAAAMLITFGIAAATAQSTSPTVQLNIGSAGFNCGRVSSPIYCYGLPVSIGGAIGHSLWLDVYDTGTNAGKGFIVWDSPSGIPEATITSMSYTGSANMPTSLTVSFTGGSTPGFDEYQGTMILNFTYYNSAGGGGRGGAGSGYRYIARSGTLDFQWIPAS